MQDCCARFCSLIMTALSCVSPQVGTLRFDYNTLAASKPKAEKKAVLAQKKDLFQKLEVSCPPVNLPRAQSPEPF